VRRLSGRIKPPELGASLRAVALAAAVCATSVAAGTERLDGCQGPPPQATTLSGPTLVFVWPCFAHPGISLGEDPTFDAERARDREMSAQYGRIREHPSAAGATLLEASGAVNLRVLHSRGKTEQVRTTTVGWRGVLVLCSTQRAKRIEAVDSLASDSEILKALEECGQQPK
jgi:hypothetical protein